MPHLNVSWCILGMLMLLSISVLSVKTLWGYYCLWFTGLGALIITSLLSFLRFSFIISTDSKHFMAAGEFKILIDNFKDRCSQSFGKLLRHLIWFWGKMWMFPSIWVFVIISAFSLRCWFCRPFQNGHIWTIIPAMFYSGFGFFTKFNIRFCWFATWWLSLQDWAAYRHGFTWEHWIHVWQEKSSVEKYSVWLKTTTKIKSVEKWSEKIVKAICVLIVIHRKVFSVRTLN